MPKHGTAKNAPGLRQALPLPFGPVARIRHDPLGFLKEGHARYGDVFRYQVGPMVAHLLAHPDHVRQVLVDRQANYPRSWVYQHTKVAAGEGLVTTEGAAWRRLRRMSQPAFHPQRVAAMATAMTDAIDVMRCRWGDAAKRGTVVDMSGEFVALTLQIVGKALLHVDLEEEVEAIGSVMEVSGAYVQSRMNNPFTLPLIVPTPRNLRVRRAIRSSDDVLYGIIARHHREQPQGEGNLITMLMEARDEETGQPMSDRELRDQLFTFVMAGFETTAAALAWTVYLVSQNAEVERRLIDEVKRILGGRPPTASDLPRLVYVRQVLEESLRLYPPVFAVARDARQADEIGGFRIPAGSIMVISPYLTHRHSEFWPDPDIFDPDRFSPEQVAKRHRFAWFPFLGGPHQCIGQGLAMMEATFAIAMIVQSFRLRLAPGARVEPRAQMSLRPRDGVPMTIHTH